LQPCGLAPTMGAQCQLLHLKGDLQARSTVWGTMRNGCPRKRVKEPLWQAPQASN
jgi:hypothetical protein